SPDGRRMAYIGKGKLWVRDLDRLAPRAVADVSELSPLCWSPDSRTIVYREQTRLWKVSSEGGEPTALCEIPGTGTIIGVAWGRSETIAFSVWRGGIYRVAAGGGSPTLLVGIDPATTVDYHFLSWTSTGDLLFLTHWKQPRDSTGHMRPMLVMFDGKKQILIDFDFDDSDAAPVLTRDGELLFLRGGANTGIWAAPFDVARRRATGEPYLVAPGAASISASDDGSLLFTGGASQAAKHELVWLDRSGKVIETLGQGHPGLSSPAVSPDGRRVAYDAAENGNRDIWVRDLVRGTETRLTFDAKPEISPAWFPSGTRLVFIERSGIQGRLLAVNADGSGGQQEIAPIADLGGTALTTYGLGITPDGTSALRIVSERGHSRVRIASFLPGGVLGPLRPVLHAQPEPDVGQSAVSPDGRLLAYVTDDPGKNSVFITRFPSADGKWEVGTAGGRSPRWARKTGEFFFVAGSGPGSRWLSVATVNPALDPPVGSVTKLFEVGALGAVSATEFDVSPDGRRLLFSRVSAGAAESTRRLVLVQNWRSEFTKKRGS
ncbi:MAG TPA: hypothetical protein VI198_00420, partial [Candidatus Eisenbacteria bacterium]